MHRTLSILIIFLIVSASLLLMFGSNIFSNAMAIEEVDWYGLDRYIKYAMDIANSPHEDDDYDPLLLEREYTNSYEEEEKKEQYTDYNTYDNYDNKYSKHSTKDNRFVCKEGQFTGFFVTNLKFCDINIVGPQGPQGPQGIQGAPGSVNVTNSYVVWRDNSLGNYDIFFRASQTSDIINLSNNTGTSISPQITSEGNHVYVVWEDSTTTTGNPEIFFTQSNDNGLTFSTPVNLSNNTGFSQTPQITSEGNHVYVVWEDRTTTTGNPEIFFTQSNDNGLTFSTPVNLSNNARTSGSPQILSEGNHVYVVWQDNTPGIETDIFFAQSNDNGLTFSTPVNLSNTIGESNGPRISSEGNHVYVVWYDDVITGTAPPDIFFTQSNDNGLTFSTPVNLSNNAGRSNSPQISTEGNHVYVVWWEDSTMTTGNPDVFFSRSNDNGITFSTPVNLSNNIGTSQEPEIAAEGNKVYVVWFDNTPGNYDIFFSKSNDNGLTFSTPVNLSNTIGESNEPQISTEGDNVYVVWQDRTPGNPDIFYITNNLDFGTFGNIINISNNAGESFNPQISSSTS